MPGIAQDNLKVGKQGWGDGARICGRRLEYHLAEAGDHVERGAQLVTDVGHKLLLGPTGVLGGMAQPLGQAIQAGELHVGIGQIGQGLSELSLAIARSLQQAPCPLIVLPRPVSGLTYGPICGVHHAERGPNGRHGNTNRVRARA